MQLNNDGNVVGQDAEHKGRSARERAREEREREREREREGLLLSVSVRKRRKREFAKELGGNERS